MIRLFNQYFPTRKILFFAGECAFITLAVVLALIVHGELKNYLIHPVTLLIKILLIMTVYQVSLFFSDFYTSGKSWTYRKLTVRLIISLIIAFFIIATIHFLSSETLLNTKVLKIGRAHV